MSIMPLLASVQITPTACRAVVRIHYDVGNRRVYHVRQE
jgi:hypothetical protein